MAAFVQSVVRILALGLCLLAVHASLALAEGKGPVPDRSSRAAMMVDVKEIYEDEIRTATTPAALSKLADKILADALATKDDATGRYVLITMAGNLASRAGDAASALRAVEAFAKEWRTPIRRQSGGALSTGTQPPCRNSPGC